MIDRQQIEEHAVDAAVQAKSRLSFVWIVPVLALLIGGWLAFKAISEKGPTITITFVSAEGLEAGKTKIRYRDVEIGQVERITLSGDIRHVVVTAELVKGSEIYLTDKTKFWVVSARVRGGSVSGLGTFLSGNYIGIDPSKEGSPAKTFTGLEVPPVVTLGQPGHHFKLKADTLGSLNIGAPVYHRRVQVGQVVSYGLDQADKAVNIQVFIEAPYHKMVTENTSFWNASGIDVRLDAQGLKVETQSMVSIISGGIAFDLPKDRPPGKEVADDQIFRLYPDYASIQEKNYSVRNYCLLLFDQSVRGLSVGAPVELYGIKVGEVVNLNLEFNPEEKKFQVPVLIALEPERILVKNMDENQMVEKEVRARLLKDLVEQRGLRAQLQSGNLLTGQLMVTLAFFPEMPKAVLSQRDNYPVIPTIPGAFERLQESLVKIIGALEKVPFDQIGGEVQQVMKEAQTTIKRIGSLAGQMDKETAPAMQSAVVELQKTLVAVQQMIGKDAPLPYNAKKALEELTRTLRAVRDLADTLDNRPQSLLFGKEKAPHE